MQAPEHEYVSRAEDLELLPGALDGIARLAACGYEPVIVSNQRGVGRGLVSPQALERIGESLQRSLEPHGTAIAGFYYCPHLIEDECDCRKPKPGLLLRGAQELGLDLPASWMIGDSPSDVEAGAAAGCRTALIGEQGDRGDAGATLVAPSLPQAAELICAAGPAPDA